MCRLGFRGQSQRCASKYYPNPDLYCVRAPHSPSHSSRFLCDKKESLCLIWIYGNVGGGVIFRIAPRDFAKSGTDFGSWWIRNRYKEEWAEQRERSIYPSANLELLKKCAKRTGFVQFHAAILDRTWPFHSVRRRGHSGVARVGRIKAASYRNSCFMRFAAKAKRHQNLT